MPIADPPLAAPPHFAVPAPVVITGRALPDPRSDQAFNIAVLGRPALTNAPSARLDQILQQVAGLALFRRSDSSSGHPTSQGVTLRSLGGTASSRALLTLDGVPQSDPFGGWINWPAYDPAALAGVRVVRGGGSVVAGPGALAGIIDLTSRADSSFDAGLEGGSRRSLDGHFYVGEAFGGGLLSISAQAERGDGFIPLTAATRGPVDRPAPYREASGRIRWVSPVGGSTELQLSALGFADLRDRGVPYTANRTRGADMSVRLVGNGHWRWSATAYAQWRNLRSSFASVDSPRTQAQRASLQDSVPSNAQGGSFEVRPPLPFELRLGADARFMDGQSNELFAYIAGNPTRRRVSGGRSATVGGFAEATWRAGPLRFSGGARIDRWRIADGELVERQIATARELRNDRYPDRNGWRPTARGGVVVDLGKFASVRSAGYLGWRLPTLNELFRPFRAGPDATAANPLLKPERLRGIEIGMDWRKAGSRISLTAFDNRLDGAIANVTLGHGPAVFPGVGFVAGDYRQRLNIGSVRVRGIELSASTTRGPWSMRADASLTDPRVRSSGLSSALDGLRPAQTAKAAVSASLGWARDGRAVSLFLFHTGSQFDDDLNRRALPPATSLGLFAAIPVSRQWQLTSRIENLLNARIVAGRGEDQTVERATPRTLWLGLRFRRNGAGN